MIVRYHELKGDSLNGLKVISDFWNLDIPRDCLEEALSRTTKAAMKKKIPQEESLANRRVSFRKERGVLSESLCKHILERLQRELIHDFGYDYSDKHEWGRYYD
jgi:nucleotidyltransferase/DNA polymerase involved in DNA repair